MFCKNCGAQISETTRFCPKCGTAATPPPSVTSPNSSFSSQQSSSFSTTAQSTAAKIKKNPIQLILIVAGVLVLLIIVIAFCNRSKNGMKSSSKAAGAYLVAVYDEDVNDIQVNYVIGKSERIQNRMRLQEFRKKLLNFMEILGTIFMAIILLFRVQLERDIPLWFTVSFFCIVIPLITVNLLISKKLREM